MRVGFCFLFGIGILYHSRTLYFTIHLEEYEKEMIILSLK